MPDSNSTSLEARRSSVRLCLNTLVTRKRMDLIEAEEGKQLLERIVSMPWRMIESQPSHPDQSTKMSTSTMTIASPSPEHEHEHEHESCLVEA